MPNPSRLRAVAVTATALLLSSMVAGCGEDAQDEDLTAQKLSWKDCPAPPRRRAVAAPPPRCRTATSGSAPP